jgi:hypothetical protein
MSAASTVVPLVAHMTTVIMHCSACGAEAKAACACGAPYVSAAARAIAAIAKNPEKSDRAIAAEIGVGNKTVSRARSTVSHDTVDKRTGKDGRTRKMPRQSKRGIVTPKQDQARAIVRKKLEANEPISPHRLQEEHGISHVTFDMAIAAETARRDALSEKYNSEPMVSVHVLIEKLVPLAEEIKEQSKRHVGLISTARLGIIASEIRRLLDEWASSDVSVRRVRGHVAPSKPPAKAKGGLS